jgi:hypothetical protein
LLLRNCLIIRRLRNFIFLDLSLLRLDWQAHSFRLPLSHRSGVGAVSGLGRKTQQFCKA